MWRNKDIFLLIFLLLLTVPAILALFHPGFFPIHDDEQVGRLFELHQDIINGQFPPRLAQDLGYGFDYPLFNFYPSFVYYIAEVFHLIGFSYIWSIKLMIASGFILAALAMYLFAKEYFGKLGGIVSSLLYTYASYHAVDAYVRGAFPEFWSFVFLPLVFWSFHKLAKNPQIRIGVLNGLILACFILTHNLMAMITAPFLGGYLFYLSFTAKSKKHFLLLTGLAISIGAGLSAYFWLPELAEKSQTMIGLLTTELANYAIHYVFPIQFWYSPWGYGGSVSGMPDGLSFQVGHVHFLLMILGIITGFFFWSKRRSKAVVIILFSVFFLFSLFMQTEYSSSIWNAFSSVMAYLQFPWRFLALSAFFSAFVGGAVFSQGFVQVSPKYRHAIFYIQLCLAGVVFFYLIHSGLTIFKPVSYLTEVTDGNYTRQDILRWNTTNLSYEYVPLGIATQKSVRGNSIIAITKSQTAHGSISVISGKMLVKTVKDIPQEKVFEVQSLSDGVVQINVFAFPGWQVFTDGMPVQYNDSNRLKLIQFPISRGSHQVQAVFTNTLSKTLGNGISLITLIGCVMLLFV